MGRRTAAGEGRGPRVRGRFAVVAARFNERIVRGLVGGAESAFARAGIVRERIDVVWVPGAFELPQGAALLARSGRYAAVVCLGVVIRGQTPHFEHVARESAAGIRTVALDTGVPVTFGVVTALDEEQAWARAGAEPPNRGAEAAAAAVEMATLAAALADRPRPRASSRRRP